MNTYPANCRANMCQLMNEIGVDAETAYGMMRMTAALMDLHPGDEKVLHMILEDCGIEVRA